MNDGETNKSQGGGQATLISEATEWAHMRCVPGEGDNAGLSIWRRHATRVRARELDGAATALDWLWGPLALASGAWLRFSEGIIRVRLAVARKASLLIILLQHRHSPCVVTDR